MNASLSPPSGVSTEVTHITPSPGSGLLATNPGGSAGAVTPSKFSVHGPEGVGVGVGDAAGVGVGDTAGVGVGDVAGVAVGEPAGVADTAGVDVGEGELPGVGVGNGTMV